MASFVYVPVSKKRKENALVTRLQWDNNYPNMIYTRDSLTIVKFPKIKQLTGTSAAHAHTLLLQRESERNHVKSRRHAQTAHWEI